MVHSTFLRLWFLVNNNGFRNDSLIQKGNIAEFFCFNGLAGLRGPDVAAERRFEYFM